MTMVTPKRSGGQIALGIILIVLAFVLGIGLAIGGTLGTVFSQTTIIASGSSATNLDGEYAINATESGCSVIIDDLEYDVPVASNSVGTVDVTSSQVVEAKCTNSGAAVTLTPTSLAGSLALWPILGAVLWLVLLVLGIVVLVRKPKPVPADLGDQMFGGGAPPVTGQVGPVSYGPMPGALPTQAPSVPGSPIPPAPPASGGSYPPPGSGQVPPPGSGPLPPAPPAQ